MAVFLRLMSKFNTTKENVAEPAVMEDISEVDPENGFRFNSHFLPEEILLQILSYIPTGQLLDYSLVCKAWNTNIKSATLWKHIYRRKYKKKPKNIEWWVYYALFNTELFSDNLLQNTCGEKKFKHWTINENGGNKFSVEGTPVGCDDLSTVGLPASTSCFATSYALCSKSQTIVLERPLFGKILDLYRPHIHASDWVAARFDAGCKYQLDFHLMDGMGKHLLAEKSQDLLVEQWHGGTWQLITVTMDDYCSDVRRIVFKHGGKDTLFWAGNYGPKMTASVVRLSFDSISETSAPED